MTKHFYHIIKIFVSLLLLSFSLSIQAQSITDTPPSEQHVCVNTQVTYTVYGFPGSTIEWHVKEFVPTDNPIGSVVLSTSAPFEQVGSVDYKKGRFDYSWTQTGDFTLQINEIAVSSSCESGLVEPGLKVYVHPIPVVNEIVATTIPACSNEKATLTVDATGSSLGGVTLQYRLSDSDGVVADYQPSNVFSNLAEAGKSYTVDVRYAVDGSSPLQVVKGSAATKTIDVTEALDDTTPVFKSNLPSSPLAVYSDDGKCSAVVTYPNPVVEDNCAFVEDLSGYTFIGKYNGHSYYLSNAKQNAKDANKAAFNAGGHLVTIESQGENDFLKDNQLLKDNVAEGIWIGLNDTLKQKDFKWVTDESLVFTNWNGSQPSDDAGNEDWTELYINWGGDKFGVHPENGKWNDNSMTSSKKYVVEFEGPRFKQIEGLPSGSSFPVGTTTNTFEILKPDGTGTGITASFDVIVADDQDPVISNCPNDMTVGYCNRTVNWTVPTATDNCGTPTLSSNYNSGAEFPVGTTEVVYTAKDASNNSSTCSFTITVLRELTLTLSGNTTVDCFGGVSTITLTPEGGDGNYTYSKDGTNYQSSPNSYDLAAGNHTLYVKDGEGCVTQKDITITQPTELKVTLTPSATEICEGVEVSFTIDATESNGNYVYMFYVNGVYVDGTGDYTLNAAGNVMTSTKFKDKDKVTIQVKSGACQYDTPLGEEVVMVVNSRPTPTITGDFAVCAEDPDTPSDPDLINTEIYFTELGMSNYSWTVVGGTIKSGNGTNEITVIWKTAGTGTVSVNYENANGCSAASAKSETITIYERPNPSSITTDF